MRRRIRNGVRRDVDAPAACCDQQDIVRHIRELRSRHVRKAAAFHGKRPGRPCDRLRHLFVRQKRCQCAAPAEQGVYPRFIVMIRVQMRKKHAAQAGIDARTIQQFLHFRVREFIKRREASVWRVDQEAFTRVLQQKAAAAKKRDPHLSISRNSSSVRIGIPSSLAFFSLLPAFSPATT